MVIYDKSDMKYRAEDNVFKEEYLYLKIKSQDGCNLSISCHFPTQVRKFVPKKLRDSKIMATIKEQIKNN